MALNDQIVLVVSTQIVTLNIEMVDIQSSNKYSNCGSKHRFQQRVEVCVHRLAEYKEQ